ncbi:RNA-dependent RNA polymerase [Macrolepiota fuliginosa MF-IS2]|uniref:RNA-dependent RNA polymerase n=1 Tax=Macrolepiota fuliginosa MF-IS2 TaxID=1400762 RepID=A0A9P6C692_9AGAR|nr:RNA-dependent RNA polymerase [Macrolepiota fuliginosa MF-IS2]
MEIFMHHIPVGLREYDVKIALAKYLHGPNFPNVKANFRLDLHWPKKDAHTYVGTFTLADLHVAQRFLEFYGGDDPPEAIMFGGNRIYFQESFQRPQSDVLDLLSRSRWIDPVEERKQNERHQKLRSSFPVNAVQSGWLCRDGVFSIEGEVQRLCYLSFNSERREVQITFPPVKVNKPTTHVIAIRQSFILSTSVHSTERGQSAIFFQLEIPPTFLHRKFQDKPFYRISTFPFDSLHRRATPYTSLAIRVLLTSRNDLHKFLSLAKLANLHPVRTYQVAVERRELFTNAKLDRAEAGLQAFDWRVAFQLLALLQNLDVDAVELIGILPMVRDLVESHGSSYVAGLLRAFAGQVRILSHTGKDTTGPVLSCLRSCHQKFVKQDNLSPPVPADEDLYQSFHVTVTPTTLFLTGPFLERSNRVTRRYDQVHQESFLRVEFREEDGLQYRLDRDVNGRAFIHDRIGPILGDGLVIVGQRFKFLAYSQSALSEHSVWFVKPFVDPEHGEVDAEKIVKSLGSFDNLEYDRDLIRCPARYAARLSQAFTATEGAKVKVNDVNFKDDIVARKGYIFTDGSGDMSKDVAREIWRAICPKRKGAIEDFPSAYQIRFRGSKGMLSINHKLKGSAIALRPSMIKFDAPESNEIEIARAILRPSPYYLNRPLIMLLEGLGVRYELLQRFQDNAVAETRDAVRSLQDAARLFETRGLGWAFRLPSTMLALTKLNIDAIHGDPHYDQLLRVGIYHVLRDLKNSARIPIPDAWTLVGVADTHGFLEENEIFACIKQPNGTVTYLEGHVLVSRSPCIHPGDVQVANAIGSPPKGSCFEVEPLPNTVVFSIKGRRPLPSCLGGGDLDGDVYNLLPLSSHREMTPMRYFEPAKYPPAKRKILARPSTMKDVADFVMEYIVSDVIGIVASNWLVIADQSQFGIQDRVCLRLAELHNDAVDYPKTGNAVNTRDIPKLKFPKPDWNAPETVEPDPVNYYQSQSAIGKLYRAINLDQHEHSLSAGSPRTDASGDTRLVEAIKARVLQQSVVEDIPPNGPIEDIFNWFCGELAHIASECSLNHRHFKPLAEEELIIGTITQKTSQPHMRKDKMSKMRELTDGLVRQIREVLEGDGSKPAEDYLRDAWTAWNLSLVEKRRKMFGARAFGWVALGALFDAIQILEEEPA